MPWGSVWMFKYFSYKINGCKLDKMNIFTLFKVFSSKKKARKDNAEIAYLFAWNHINEILKKEVMFKKNKGKWISHVEI
jgi:hypothetical protein